MSQSLFRLKAPCADCPFRCDRPPFLSEHRVRSILNGLIHQDTSFYCHKTIHLDEETQVDEATYDSTWRPISEDACGAFCAGALILLDREGSPNRLPRLAQMIGWHDPALIKNPHVIYQSAADMVNAATQDAPTTTPTQASQKR